MKPPSPQAFGLTQAAVLFAQFFHFPSLLSFPSPSAGNLSIQLIITLTPTAFGSLFLKGSKNITTTEVEVSLLRVLN